MKPQSGSTLTSKKMQDKVSNAKADPARRPAAALPLYRHIEETPQVPAAARSPQLRAHQTNQPAPTALTREITTAKKTQTAAAPLLRPILVTTAAATPPTPTTDKKKDMV